MPAPMARRIAAPSGATVPLSVRSWSVSTGASPGDAVGGVVVAVAVAVVVVGEEEVQRSPGLTEDLHARLDLRLGAVATHFAGRALQLLEQAAVVGGRRVD